jgi:hypothetical protein
MQWKSEEDGYGWKRGRKRPASPGESYVLRAKNLVFSIVVSIVSEAKPAD